MISIYFGKLSKVVKTKPERAIYHQLLQAHHYLGAGSTAGAQLRYLASRRIAADWLTRYSYSPVLLETFVEQDRFTGTCYRAAN